MTDTARQALRELIVQFGESLCDEPRRFMGLLLDRCPDDRRGIFLLSSALEEHVVADLRQGMGEQSWGVVFARLYHRLVDRRGLGDGYARWAVESWALALGVIDESALGPVTATNPQPAPSLSTGIIPVKLIPAGEFWMGSPSEDPEALDDETPRHQVRISRPFYLAATPVTQAQYEEVTSVAPSYFQGQGDNPVEQVSWHDTVQFCNEMSRKEGLAPYYSVQGTRARVAGGPGYRLPSEAEWEYACRAGTESWYYFGNETTRLGEYVWYRDNSNRRTQPVGRKGPNAWGLFDMLGNVWEWCGDWYDAKYYRNSPGADPLCGVGVASRVIRGGCWFYNPRHVRAAYRYGYAPGFRYYALGFRVARSWS